ncbi:trypsin-like serine protease [Paeniclostridium hominis]|uniref:trypsin-like serine protease n=1 Tax=Paeniclostridium hominis TaxID=2764329 RepID=UPI0022DFE197|nr:trypsin-like serine protease [Paeniclostridium hominis]
MSKYQSSLNKVDSITCKIIVYDKLNRHQHGSGVILNLKESECVYILTAKHCIWGDDAQCDLNNMQIDILVRNKDYDNEYVRVSIDKSDDILYDKDDSEDIAIIVLKKNRIDSLKDISSIGILDEESVLNECIIRGYPAPYNDSSNNQAITIPSCKYIDTNILATETKLESQSYGDSSYNLKGCSGGGVFTLLNGDFYLIGIVYEFGEVFERIIINPVRKYNKLLIKSKYKIIPMEKNLNSANMKIINDITENSLYNLGERFNRNFNVDTEIYDILNKFYITDIILDQIYELLKEAKTTVSMLHKVNNKDLLSSIDILINNILKSRVFDYDLLKEMFDIFIDKASKLIDESKEENRNDNIMYFYGKLINLNEKLDNYRIMLNSRTLILTGTAGIGKSHSVASFCYENFYLKNKACIFILGQQLNDSADIISMIEKILHINGTLQSFLDELENIAEYNNIIIPFVIDAINEGRYSEIWKTQFNGLASIFSKYKRIKLTISIRSTYIRKCLPNDFKKIEGVIEVEHRGFEQNSIDAVRQFFEFYKLQLPTFPILYSQYYNPLFLHILCKTLTKLDIQEITEYKSFNDIFEKYFYVIEEEVSIKLGYMKSLKLIKRVIDKIIEYSLEHDKLYGIEVEIFYEIVNEQVNKFGVNSNQFIQILIEENIFFIEIYGEEDNEYVRFAYERYHNILSAKFLLKDVRTIEEVISYIKCGPLKSYFRNPYNGITEELFILIPDRYDVEVITEIEEQYVSHNLKNYLNSLIWRDKEKLQIDIIKKIINEEILPRKYYFNKFIEMLIMLSPIEGHPLNILFFQQYLKKLEMHKRDHLLSNIFYRGQADNRTLNNLISFCFSRAIKKTSKESLKYIIFMVSWSMCSSNLKYRKLAMKALTIALESQVELSEDLILNFKTVDDPYIKEGIYCSIYGFILRSNLKNKDLEKICQLVYDDIFMCDEVYPNILVRDYARGIIEYSYRMGCKMTFDIKDVQPPYRSKWYENIPSNEEIHNLNYDYRDDKVERVMYSANKIISSMATNTGEQSMMYGDFGRYVFEGWVDPWDYHFKPYELSNIVIKEIFTKWGYNPKLHGEFDLSVKSYDRNRNECERIGKKYQRIASYEMLARLSDNFSPGNIERIYSEDYEYKSSKKFERFLSSIHEINEDELDMHEDIDLEYEEPTIVFKEYPYEGPWQINLRGVDTSILIKKNTEKEVNYLGDIFKIPKIPDNEWASKNSPKLEHSEIIYTKYNEDEFIVLEMYNSWNSEELDNSISNKSYFVKSIALIVDEEKIDRLLSNEQITGYCYGNNNNEIRYVFAKEFPEASSYLSYKNEMQRDYYEDVDYIETGINYSTEESEDGFIDSFSMPSEFIIKNLSLHQKNDGKWYDKNGSLVSFDLSLDGYRSMLIIKKDIMDKLLKEKNLSIIWCMYIEKQGGKYHYSERNIVYQRRGILKKKLIEEESWTNKFMHLRNS